MGSLWIAPLLQSVSDMTSEHKWCTIRVPLLVVMSVTRHAMYALRNIEARSWNLCYSGKKSISVTYSEFMFVAFGIQHAVRMRHFVICGLSGCAVFFHTVSYNGTIFGGKKVY